MGQLGADLAPAGEVGGPPQPQVGFAEGVGPLVGGDGGHDADSPPHDEGRRGDFAPGGAAFVVAGGAEDVLQVVVRRREPVDRVTTV